jgi:chromosome segregation ATPase
MEPFFRRNPSNTEPSAPMHTAVSALARASSSAPSPRHAPDAKLTALGESLLAIDQEYEARRAAMEAEITRAKELQRQLANLNKHVDDASEILARADSQFQACKAAVAQVRNGMLTAWGSGHVDGSVDRPPSYQALVEIEASVADYPRVREHLVTKVKAAETALSDFQRENKI